MAIQKPRKKAGAIPDGTRYCKRCNQTLPTDQFFPSMMGKYRGTCKACTAETRRRWYATHKDYWAKRRKRVDSADATSRLSAEWRRANKKSALLYKGGKCVRCGYDEFPCAIDFHHSDPDEKSNPVAELLGFLDWDAPRVQAELDKCVLLCANCHRATHFAAV